LHDACNLKLSCHFVDPRLFLDHSTAHEGKGMSDWAKWCACLLVFQRSNVGQNAVAELVILYTEWLALESSHDGKVSDNE